MASASQENAYDQRTIRNDAALCRKLFLDTISCYRENDANDQVINSQIQDEFGRFNLWAARNDVFGPVLASLDSQLADSPALNDQLLMQLKALQSRLEELYEEITNTAADTEEVPTLSSKIRESSSHSSYPATIVCHIHVTIDWLRRIANLIAKEDYAPHDQQLDSQQVTDESGNDAKTSATNRFEYMVQNEYPNLPEYLGERLVKTMTIRQKNILSRRSGRPPWTFESNKSQDEFSNTPARVLMEPESGRAVVLRAEDSYTTVIPVRHPDALNPEDYKGHAALFPTSQARTHEASPHKRLQSASLSRNATLGQAYICAYCFITLSSEEALDNMGWATHFGRDLTPYICLFEKCDRPNLMFTSRSSWLTHMGTQHCFRWHCVATGHDPVSYNDEELFIRHMEDAHTGSFSSDKLRVIADSSAHISLPIVTDCPFCPKSGTDEDLEEHVVGHLYHFALQSLPESHVEVRQSNTESTDEGGIQEVGEQQDSSPVAVPEASSNREAAKGFENTSIGNEEHWGVSNTAKKQQVHTEQVRIGANRSSQLATNINVPVPSIDSASPSKTSTAPSMISTSSSTQPSRKYSQGRAETFSLWTCCYCHNSGNTIHHVACWNCGVQRCSNCVGHYGYSERPAGADSQGFKKKY